MGLVIFKRCILDFRYRKVLLDDFIDSFIHLSIISEHHGSQLHHGVFVALLFRWEFIQHTDYFLLHFVYCVPEVNELGALVLKLIFHLVMNLGNLCTKGLFEFIFKLKHCEPQFFIATLDLSLNSSNVCLVSVSNDLKLGLMRVDVLVAMLIGVDN